MGSKLKPEMFNNDNLIESGKENLTKKLNKKRK